MILQNRRYSVTTLIIKFRLDFFMTKTTLIFLSLQAKMRKGING